MDLFESPTKRRVLAVALTPLAAVCLRAQSQPTPQAPPAFEVASVKPSDPDARGGVIRPLPGNQTYIANNASVRNLMTVAYTVTDRQITGGPAWLDTDRFDIAAKAARPGTMDELHRMLQTLLEDRFQLKLRHETREMPVWLLAVDKKPKLTPHDSQDQNHAPMGLNERGVLAGSNVSMSYFAFILSRLLDRNVIDRTGLPGSYDLSLEFTLERSVRGPAPPSPAEPLPDNPTIFTALREQLGLKLESGKGPVDFLTIEHAEKPSAN